MAKRRIAKGKRVEKAKISKRIVKKYSKRHSHSAVKKIMKNSKSSIAKHSSDTSHQAHAYDKSTEISNTFVTSDQPPLAITPGQLLVGNSPSTPLLPAPQPVDKKRKVAQYGWLISIILLLLVVIALVFF